MADIGKKTKESNIDVPQIRRQVSCLEILIVAFVKSAIPVVATGTHERGTDRAGKREKLPGFSSVNLSVLQIDDSRRL